VNGQADLMNRELRTAHSYAFFDDPSRLFRLFRFQHVLGFTLHPRTQSQLDNALLENYQAAASASTLAREIRAAAQDVNAAAMLEGLDSHGLLTPLAAALTGPKLNAAGIGKFEKLAHSVLPSGYEGGWLAFLHVLTEKLGARERAEAIRAFELTPDEITGWKKLELQANKLEEALKAARTQRPSHVWEALHGATSDEVLMVLYGSPVRVVQDRIRAFYEKYLPLAQEITDEEVEAAGGRPGTAKFQKVRRALITTRLNARPRKIEVIEPEPVQVAVAGGGRGRR
jgi:tRNA nucleotidyltransferase (CCA-adding enzyme)